MAMRVLSSSPIAIVLFCVLCAVSPADAAFRPPAVPLVVIDPYTSIWSFADNLTDSDTVHWSGEKMPLTGLLAIDGTVFRWMGSAQSDSNDLPALQQTSVVVLPTSTIYNFAHPSLPVALEATFVTPAFLDDINGGVDSVGPISYITLQVTNKDSAPHAISAYYDSTAYVAVQDDNEVVQWSSFAIPQSPQIKALKLGSQAQNVLGRTGDGIKIDWGFHYIATDFENSAFTAAAAGLARQWFATNQTLPPFDATGPRAANSNTPVLALALNFGSVPPASQTSTTLVFAYDDIASIEYFGAQLPAFWRQAFNNSVENLIASAFDDLDLNLFKCTTLNAQLISALQQSGEDKFVTIGSLAYRQVTGATKLVWNANRQESWLFMKEISSDGDVSTVDVIYPASPFFIAFAPQAMQRLLLPVLAYANNETSIQYNLPWAPHHLGTWPVCDIQPSQQEQMPMEETANFLLMLAAGIQRTGDISVVQQYWPLIQSWASYLTASLPDPGDQLCTDDFEGPSPHNVNLAAKGIVGLAAYAALQKAVGESQDDTWKSVQVFVGDWMKMANDSDHYRLQYDLPNTWSLKYNLLFQSIIKLDNEVFPDSVIQNELSYYATKRNAYGIPLDDRAVFTKSDWQAWVGALGSKAQFLQVVSDLYQFLHESPSRVPFSDWYFTDTAKVTGFQARPVVGGIFARLIVN